MTTLPSRDYRLALVESLEQSDEEILAQLHANQRVKLNRRHPNWTEIKQRLEDSRQRHVPIAIWLDQDGHILGAGWAERDYLLGVSEQGARPGWVAVYLATGGSYPLQKSNPDYQRVMEVIRSCRETRCPVWLVTAPGNEGVELIDVRVLRPEDDDLLSRISRTGWV
jgi:hypothetical protein